jgi:hypothetical protein
MADVVPIQGAGTTAKVRNPLGVIGLNIITLGIYGIFYWYFINREMADLGRARGRPDLGDNPMLSVIAITIGGLVLIPAILSFWNTLKRIETSQDVTMGSNNFSPVLCVILVLLIITSPVATYLMQSNLNQSWRAQAGG